MTPYTRQFEIYSPLKVRTLTWSEFVLAEEAAKKEEAERAARKVEMHRVSIPHQTAQPVTRGKLLTPLQRLSLARLEGKESVWRRALSWVRNFSRKMGLERDALQHLERIRDILEQCRTQNHGGNDETEEPDLAVMEMVEE
jgi:hypothetical protein